MNPKTLAAAAALGALALPASAQAHVSVHPNVVPAGASATLTLRVPNESDTASTTRISILVPPGFTEVPVDPPVGWTARAITQKLAKPIQTDDGPIDTSVREIVYSGGRIPPGHFAQFPMLVTMPDKPGAVLAFKTIQAYSDGKATRWIGPADADDPAPTIDVSAAKGALQDVAGGEAGPPANAGGAQAGGSSSGSSSTAKAAAGSSGGGGSKGLAIAALVVGALGLLAGIAGLAAARRAREAAARV